MIMIVVVMLNFQKYLHEKCKALKGKRKLWYFLKLQF